MMSPPSRNGLRRASIRPKIEAVTSPGDGARYLEHLEIRPKKTVPRGLAVVLHGRGATKEDLLDLGTLLATDGLVVVLPNAPIQWGDGFAWFDSSAPTRDLPSARASVANLTHA